MRAAGAAKHPHASLILFRSHPSPVLDPVLTQHPHFNHGSRFSHPMARGLFLNYSCVPVGNHISSHCGEYRLPTRIGGQVTCRKIRCVSLTAAALVTADSDEIAPLALKFARVCITSHRVFFFFLLFFLTAIFLPH